MDGAKMSEAAKMVQPTIGRIVHFVLQHGASAGQHRPAIIVKAWPMNAELVNLQVFTDGMDDNQKDRTGMNQPPNMMWLKNVRHSAEHENGTWHTWEED